MSKKSYEICTVISQCELCEGIFDLCIKTEEMYKNASCGQFVSLYTKDAAHLLPRPISICEIDCAAGALRLVYRVAGYGTAEFSKLCAGDKIKVLGPLGNGYDLKNKKAFVMGGGIGIPPMLETAKQLLASGLAKEDIQIVLGYRDVTFLKDEFEKYGTVYVATEDGSLGSRGNVMDAVRENRLTADVIYACGPKPMLRALKKYAEENDTECYISMEERMACGIGACLGCVTKTTGIDDHSEVNNKRICADGPVFDAREVEL